MLHIPLRFGYALAHTVSSIYYFFSKGDRQAVIKNLKILFPDYDDRKIELMARTVFINFGKYLVDFFRFSKIDKGYIEERVKLEGLEHLKSALKLGKGVIATTAHLGNWELGSAVVSALGFPVTVVALEHKDKEINRFFIRQRQMKGVEVIPIGAALRRCFSVLGNNHLLALAGDRDYYDHGLEIELFGKKMFLPKGPAVFSRRCGSPIIPIFMTRNSDDTFTLKFREAIRPHRTRDERRDLILTTERIARVLEKEIMRYPTQWYVFREFWKKIGWRKGGV